MKNNPTIRVDVNKKLLTEARTLYPETQELSAVGLTHFLIRLALKFKEASPS